jgi:hypothetical protein
MRTPLAIIAMLVLSVVTSPLAMAAPDELMACKKLSVKTPKAYPSSGTVEFLCKAPGAGFVLPAGLTDPTNEASSVALTIWDLGSPLYIAPGWQLSSAFWTPIGTPPGSKGFRYKNKQPGAPCRYVVVTAKQIKGKCRAELGLGTMPVVGDVGMQLYFTGGDTKAYCAQFGGTDIHNETTALLRKDSPAPAVCLPPF